MICKPIVLNKIYLIICRANLNIKNKWEFIENIFEEDSTITYTEEQINDSNLGIIKSFIYGKTSQINETEIEKIFTPEYYKLYKITFNKSLTSKIIIANPELKIPNYCKKYQDGGKVGKVCEEYLTYVEVDILQPKLNIVNYDKQPKNNLKWFNMKDEQQGYGFFYFNGKQYYFVNYVE